MKRTKMRITISGHNINSLKRVMLDSLTYMNRRQKEGSSRNQGSHASWRQRQRQASNLLDYTCIELLKKTSSLFIHYINIQKKLQPDRQIIIQSFKIGFSILNHNFLAVTYSHTDSHLFFIGQLSLSMTVEFYPVDWSYRLNAFDRKSSSRRLKISNQVKLKCVRNSQWT